jgi:hypothetical protein
MPATITAKYLGDATLEEQIREQLEKELKAFDKWRVTVLGAAGSDLWEIKVYGPDGQAHGVKRLDSKQTVGTVVEEAAHMVMIASQEKAL